MLYSWEIAPSLAAEPMRHRRSGETWLSWACEGYAHTLAEIELAESDRKGWVRLFGWWPGPEYMRCLIAQRDRMATDIDRAVNRARNGSC